jgi:hypothetical protein
MPRMEEASGGPITRDIERICRGLSSAGKRGRERSICARLASVFVLSYLRAACVSIRTFLLVGRGGARKASARDLRQYSYFCASKASKLRKHDSPQQVQGLQLLVHEALSY